MQEFGMSTKEGYQDKIMDVSSLSENCMKADFFRFFFLSYSII